jgi:hypothetical protein
MADGALRTDVLRVLDKAGVEVCPLSENRFRLCKGDTLLTIRMHEVVSRTTLGNLERRFGIPKARFFPALKAVPPFSRRMAQGSE